MKLFSIYSKIEVELNNKNAKISVDIRKKPVETRMYYCKSRYYVYEWCRWLNGDSAAYLDTENINGINLFCYCYNNPLY